MFIWMVSSVWRFQSYAGMFKQGLLTLQLYGIHARVYSEISNFMLSSDFLRCCLRCIPTWPSKQIVLDTIPQSFEEIYLNTRVVIDCTEIFSEMSASNQSKWATFSKYKHCNTAAALLGIALRGAVSFVSDLNANKNSNKQTTSRCVFFLWYHCRIGNLWRYNGWQRRWHWRWFTSWRYVNNTSIFKRAF